MNNEKSDSPPLDSVRLRIFDETFSYANIGAALVDNRLRFQRTNRALSKLLGFPQNEFVGKSPDDFILPEGKAAFQNSFERLSKEKSQKLLAEAQCGKKSGETVWLEFSASPFFDKGGNPEGYTLFVQDISQRKASEQRHYESDQRFRSTFENAAVGIAHLSPAGHWLRMNHKMCVITGYPKEELLKLKFEDITHPADTDADWELARKVLSSEIDTYSIDKRYIRKDGSVTWIGLTVSLQRSPDGKPQYFISIVRDINAQKRAEQALINREEELLTAKEAAEKASKSKDEFLSVMSHELRTPLNPIIGFAQLLAQQENSAFVQEAANFTLTSARRMLELVDSVLSFAHLDKKDKNLALETFSVTQLINDLIAINPTSPLKIQNGSASLTEIKKEEQLFAPLEAIRQCLRNLSNNALKYGGKDGATITFGLVDAKERPKKLICFEVSDFGPGVPPSYVPSLFTPFNQADGSFTRKHDGLGLGLAICEKLAAQMEGSIKYRPNLPHGALFSLTIPVSVLKQKPEANLEPETPQATSSNLNRPTILIVEDNQENADYFTYALRQFELETIHVRSGEDAIELSKQRPFNIAMVDIAMSGLSGLETLEELKKIPGFYERTTCIAVTAHTSDSMRQVCLKQGFHAFLSKPVTLPALRHTIQNLLIESKT